MSLAETMERIQPETQHHKVLMNSRSEAAEADPASASPTAKLRLPSCEVGEANFGALAGNDGLTTSFSQDWTPRGRFRRLRLLLEVTMYWLQDATSTMNAAKHVSHQEAFILPDNGR